jgi:hypothetical protein
MLGLVLAVPLACTAAPSTAADDPMNSKREVGALFATLAVDQPLAEGLPLLGARLTAVFQRRFGLEAGVAKVWFVNLGELSVVAVVKPFGNPVLLKAGLSHLPGQTVRELGIHDAATGFHVGASLLTGDADDGVRWRFDWTHRLMHGYRGFSTLGVGLVLQFHPLGS